MTSPVTQTPMTVETAPDFLTAEEAGQILRLSRHSVYEAIRQHKLPVVRIGRRYLISKVTLQRLLNHEQKEDTCVGASNNG